MFVTRTPETQSLLHDDSLYAQTRWVCGVRVIGRSRVRSWEGWPEDVRDVLRLWNRHRRLSFQGMDVVGRIPPQPTFKCPDCERFINPSGSTACQLDGVLVCDDCMVTRVRAALSPEPECTCGSSPTPTQHDFFCPWREWWLSLREAGRA